MGNNSAAQRDPEFQTRPALSGLAALPVFYNLSGKKVVVAGGSRAALWKAELMAAAGAQTIVVAATFDSGFATLASQSTHVELTRRRWAEGDFEGAALAIAETGDPDEAALLRAAARVHGVQINIIDKPQWSDFQFGAIVERSPLVVAISTGGGAPVLGQAIRARIETLLPDGIRRWAEAARAWRPKVAALGLDLHGRRKVWEVFARRALSEPQRAPGEADFAAMTDAAAGKSASVKLGTVTLAGAGPGDPELLTLRAVRALQSADAVLFDDLVSPQVLDLARREADRLSVGKRGYKPSCTQEDICGLMIALAREGKHVVRLKGGDPMIFGRANEEIAALRDAGIPVTVVPGVTAASAAAASLGVSLTERTLARRLQFVTAHAKNGALPDDLNWPALADPAATTIVYMGVRTLPAFAARALAEGLPADTPAVIVERASHADERVVAGTISSLPELAVQARIKGPALTIIGQAARMSISIN